MSLSFLLMQYDDKFNRKLSVFESVNRQWAVTFIFISLQDLFIHRCKQHFFQHSRGVEKNSTKYYRM